VFGNNPREGYFKENQFFHPDLRFRVTFPEGWNTNNGKQAVIAVSPQQDAMVEVSVAKEPTADAAARAFLAQKGLTSGYPVRTSMEEMARQRPSPVPAATLALVNQVEPQTPLEPGRLVKWIVGQPLP